MDRKQLDGFVEKIDMTIARCGHVVQGVGAEPPFAYTIGNFQRGLPELFISGLPFDYAQVFLNEATRMMVEDGTRWADRARTGALAVGYDTTFRLVDPMLVDSELGILKMYCRRKGAMFPPVYQLVWPDPQGRFPWDIGFDETMRRYQPVLYEGTTH